MKEKILQIALTLAILVIPASFNISAKSVEESQVKVEIYQPSIPIVIDRANGILAEICINVPANYTDEVYLNHLNFSIHGLNYKEISNLKLLYSGSASNIPSRSSSIVLHDRLRIMGANQDLMTNPQYTQEISILNNLKKYASKSEKNSLSNLTLDADKKLVTGKNYFYLTIDLSSKKVRDISQTIEISDVKTSLNTNSEHKDINYAEKCNYNVQRMGVKVRTYGDDNSLFYRIPGLVTTNRGTLIGVYDVRYESSQDLQANIDIGVSRSLDGGKTWQKMVIAMDMGQWGGLPDSQNGIGDPSVLYDPVTDRIFIVATWTHGINGGRAWSGVGNGLEPETTAQLMMVTSDDDGKTWSEPRNITKQVKDPKWYFTLQGPGRGIAMKNGILVFPMQYKDEKTIPHSFFMYSKDHGKTWKRHNAPVPETTEAQVAELPDGSLMLNMRNNRRTGRKVYTTTDFGKTWKKHPSCDKLIEPVCMASLISVPADKNVFKKDILLFSNPAVKDGRYNITIQISFDNGLTWEKEHRVLLDQERGWGYSCLSMIDEQTVGILYESSVAQLLFQAVKLKDLTEKSDK